MPFVCREKEKPHVRFEAAIFQDRESYEIPEEYDRLSKYLFFDQQTNL